MANIVYAIEWCEKNKCTLMQICSNKFYACTQDGQVLELGFK